MFVLIRTFVREVVGVARHVLTDSSPRQCQR